MDINETGKTLVQYKLLKKGVKLFSFKGSRSNDIIFYSKNCVEPKLISVKSLEKPADSKVKGRSLLKWTLSHQSKSDYVALVDVSSDKVWLLELCEFRRLSRVYNKCSTLSYRVYDDTSLGDRLAEFNFDARVSSTFLE